MDARIPPPAPTHASSSILAAALPRASVPILLAACLAAAACGVKGPPRPPLPKAPDPVRGLLARQSGESIVVRWSPPRRRQDGEPIGSPLAYEIRALVLERPPDAGAVATPSPPPGPGGGSSLLDPRLREEEFVKSSRLVASAGEEADARSDDRRAGDPAPREVALGPDRFPGTRLAAARIALAVIAIDDRGRRSPARPIVLLDPVEPLPAIESLTAEPGPEGVRLAWKLPASLGPPGRVNVYRAAGAEPFPVVPIPSSPFEGERALDAGAGLGASYRYEARLVAVGSGLGLREGPPAGPIEIRYEDRFAPGAPALVTVDLLPGSEGGERSWQAVLAWSSPLDADVAGYRVYRAAGGERFSLLASLPETRSSLEDGSIEPGREYLYRVTAIDGASPANESTPSEEVKLVVPEGAR
jgi:hypothetical protein